jgi:replicative DNA helicase
MIREIDRDYQTSQGLYLPSGTPPQPPGLNGLQAMAGVIGDILQGNVNPLIATHTFPDFELGPGLVSVIGAPPASGKTTLAMQLINEAMELNDDQRAYVLNCEMSPRALMRRELSRITGIHPKAIRFNVLTQADRALIADTLEQVGRRLQRLQLMPGDASSLGTLASLPPGIVLVDYLQRFNLGGGGDARANVNDLMDYLRRLADIGHSVLAISATKRTADGKHDKKELGLSSFRESSEVEYAADACYVLQVDPQDGLQKAQRAVLACVKNRNDEERGIDLGFDKKSMRFLPAVAAGVYDSPIGRDDDDPFGGSDF